MEGVREEGGGKGGGKGRRGKSGWKESDIYI